MDKLWKVSWLEYKGYDCNGHTIRGIFNGTLEEATRYVKDQNEGEFYDFEVIEFDIKTLDGKGLVF